MLIRTPRPFDRRDIIRRTQIPLRRYRRCRRRSEDRERRGRQ